MSEGMKDLIFTEEKPINGEKQFRLINWLTEDQIKRLAWALDFEGVTIVEKGREEKIRR